jgi:hypothetical protein
VPRSVTAAGLRPPRRSRSASAEIALARWLSRFFSALPHLGQRTPPDLEQRVVPEPAVAALGRRDHAATTPSATVSRLPARRGRRPCETAPADRSHLRAASATWLDCPDTRPTGPANRADETPGAPPRAATSSPVSSARAAIPVAALTARALSRALSSSVSPVSSTSGQSRSRDEGHLRQHPGEDLGHLGDLVRVLGGDDEPVDHDASADACAATSLEMPSVARSSSPSSRSRENGAPSAVPWISMRSPPPVITTFMSTSAAASCS